MISQSEKKSNFDPVYGLGRFGGGGGYVRVLTGQESQAKFFSKVGNYEETKWVSYKFLGNFRTGNFKYEDKIPWCQNTDIDYIVCGLLARYLT